MENDINQQLIQACIEDNLEEVNRLIEDGANPNAVDNEGWTVLMVMAKLGHAEVAKVLLAAGADVNAVGDHGQTALMVMGLTWDEYAAAKIAEILLSAGANVNAADNEGETALMWAANLGHAKIAKMLLSAGANPNATDNGKTALDIAKEKVHSEVVRILEEAGAT